MTSPAPDPQATAPQPEPSDGITWEIRGYTDEDPFEATLTFSDATNDLFWLDLDPATTRDLAAALTQVRAAQVAAVTGRLTAAPLAEHPAGHTDSTGTPSGTGEAAWWRRHRAAATIFTIVAVIMLVSFVTGGTRI